MMFWSKQSTLYGKDNMRQNCRGEGFNRADLLARGCGKCVYRFELAFASRKKKTGSRRWDDGTGCTHERPKYFWVMVYCLRKVVGVICGIIKSMFALDEGKERAVVMELMK